MIDDTLDPWAGIYGIETTTFQDVVDPIEGGGGFPDGRGSFDEPITIDPLAVTVDGDAPVDDGGSGDQGTDQEEQSTSEPADGSDDAETGGSGPALGGIAVGDLVAVAVIALVTWYLVREL